MPHATSPGVAGLQLIDEFRSSPLNEITHAQTDDQVGHGPRAAI